MTSRSDTAGSNTTEPKSTEPKVTGPKSTGSVATERGAAQRRADALAPAGVRESWRLLKELPSAPSHARLLVLFCVFALTITAMNVGSQLLGRIVDVINGMSLPLIGSGRSGMAWLLVLVVGVLIIEVTGRALGNYLINSRTRRMSVDLRTSALDSVLRAPVPRIMELGTGNVITRLSKDIDLVVAAVSMMGERLAVTVFMLPITAISMLIIHPAYILLFVLSGAIMYPFIKGTIRDIPAVANVVSSVEAQRNNVLLDTIRGLDTLRQFKLNEWAIKRQERYSWDTVQARGDKLPYFNRIGAQGSLAFGILLVGALVMSVPMLNAGWVTQGEAAAVVLLMMRLEMHVFNVLFFAGEIQQALTSLGRAVSLAKLVDAHQPPAPAALTKIPDVVIDHLTYAYPGGTAVLNDVSITLEAGTTTALVGTSGAGKSTLAALVAGLQYPTDGRIVIGGVDTKTVPNTWVTQHVALITQEVHLFSGALRDDLLLALPDATDEQLWAALEKVGLDATSRWLPEGLDTLIGAGHEEIGAEAAQQISLARMVLRQPPVLIMDEATSEAGSEHAAVLENAARAVTKGRTSLVVAHRLDQAREADRILVMEQGRIVEDGTHTALLSAGGRYARAYRQWERGQQ